jgi:hypothetical protein
MTDTMREKIARAIWHAQWEEAWPREGGIEHAHALEVADSVLALFEPAMEENERLREALCLTKLACLGTSEKDGWTALRILGCVTRLCIDAGITESYRELASDRRYEALVAQRQNRIDFALANRAALSPSEKHDG